MIFRRFTSTADPEIDIVRGGSPGSNSPWWQSWCDIFCKFHLIAGYPALSAVNRLAVREQFGASLFYPDSNVCITLDGGFNIAGIYLGSDGSHLRCLWFVVSILCMARPTGLCSAYMQTITSCAHRRQTNTSNGLVLCLSLGLFSNHVHPGKGLMVYTAPFKRRHSGAERHFHRGVCRDPSRPATMMLFLQTGYIWFSYTFPMLRDHFDVEHSHSANSGRRPKAVLHSGPSDDVYKDGADEKMRVEVCFKPRNARAGVHQGTSG